MILKFDEYKISTDLVEEVIRVQELEEIEPKINEAVNQIDDRNKRHFLTHTNSLFLNILLNRLSEVGEVGEVRARKAREIIRLKINEDYA